MSLFCAQLLAHDELEAGPDFTDRAYFDVNEPERERQLADRVFGDGGGNLRRLLRPGDPERRLRFELFPQRGEVARQISLLSNEKMNDIDARAGAALKQHTGWKRFEELSVAIWYTECQETASLFDPELLSKWRARIARSFLCCHVVYRPSAYQKPFESTGQ
ncbi:MAG: hypothetical protein JWN14_1037 [Chthonomonadales bacterium]|nr:hypothetical protein [Chthonomonadales bacterium]